ncbi:MAG: polyprenyl synthetase family protein [Flavobacteriales bacterium]
MHSTTELQARIQEKIDGFCRVNGDEAILQPVNYTMQAGGKRIRPVLALMAANLFTDDIDDAVYPALSIEVFHNFTLLHDDIMDRAPLRRGRPTVHEHWDVNTAILSGDAMLIQAYQLLCKAPDKYLRQALVLFSKTAMDVCKGQQWDMDFEMRTDVTLPQYMEMIRLKTAVLLGGAMELGALIAGADEADQKHVYDFGENLGIMFQLWDDYLDAFGDGNKVGKQTGGDIISDKKTFLLIKAFELADEKQLIVLSKYSGQRDEPKEKVQAVLEIFEALGLQQMLEMEMSRYYRNAMQSLQMVRAEANRKEIIENFAAQLVVREH